jgi:outer membrane protein OmpA-like peptidoglycan-associated protein
VLNFIAKYDFTKVGVLAIQYQMENLLIGGSYDLPFINNVAHHGAFEIGAKYQKLVKSKRKFKKRRKKRGKYKIPPHVLRHRKNQSENVTDLIDSTDSTFIENFVSDDIPANVDNDIPFSINKKIAFKFEFNKSTISPETEKYILNTIEFMTENELTHIIITGHTDNIGSSKYNLKLSKQRAETIARLLVSEGNIDADRIIIDGKGDTEPLNQNFNELDRELNRRVELYFFYDK